METTFLMIKPDGIQRGLAGNIISRIEKRGYRIIAMRMLDIDRSTAEQHYSEHKGKDFYEPLLEYITSGPVLAMAVRGESVIKQIRNMVGATDPKDAASGTIRGDFGIEVSRNIVHAADSEESAQKELDLFFDEEELVDYTRVEEEWIYE